MPRFLVIVLLCIPLSLPGQRVTVSEPISIRNDIAYDLIGEMGDRLLLFQDKASTFWVTAFDDAMRTVWEKEIRLDGRRPTILGVMGDQQTFSLLYYYRESGNYFLKIQSYDAAANMQDSITLADLGSFLSLPQYEVIRSEDRSQLLIYRIEGFNNVNAMIVNVPEQRLSWEGTFSPENIVMERDFQQILLSDDGELFFILNEDNRKPRAESHRYTIFMAGERVGESPKVITITMGGLLSYDSYFSIDNLNRLLVAGGMYYEDHPNRAIGHFFLSYDLERNTQPILTYEPFEESFVVNLMGQRVNRKHMSVFETSIRQIVHRQDGGVLIIGERNRIFERQSAASRASFRYSGHYIIDYYYDDLFVISVHPDGATHWKAILPKKQYSQDDEAAYSSYFLITTPTSLRLLFNDQIRQENTVSEYVISSTGTFQRNAVLSTQHQELQLRIRDAIQTSANEVIIPSERRNRLKLVRVYFD